MDDNGQIKDDDSDYCSDLVEIYEMITSEQDVQRFKAIHLMDKGYTEDYENDPSGEKFQCPETGAHFDYLDMINRLKYL